MRNTLEHDDRRLRQFRRLTEVSRALTYALSLEEVLDLTVQRAAELLDAPKAILMLASDEGLLSIKAAVGIDDAVASRFAEPLNETLSRRLQGLFGLDDAHFIGVPLVVNGNVTGILAVGRASEKDSAEEHEWLLSALADQAAVALEKSRLDQTAEFRERVLGIVGHDLRNPLNAIAMAAHMLLLEDELPDKHTRLARRISNSAARMESIIDQLTDFARARLGGGIPLVRAAVDMDELCRQVVDELSTAHPMVELRLDSRAAAVGQWDRGRVAQLISNLVGNAIQHGEQGAPVLVTLNATAAEAVIEVHNQGPPIPPSLLTSMFDPFRRDEARTPTTNNHLGLGLYIAEQITKAHGGSLVVTSSAGSGTTFSLRLPR